MSHCGTSTMVGPDPLLKLKVWLCRASPERPSGPGLYYTSAVGVDGGSDCVRATRERGRLCLAFGSAAASFTSDFDLERRVRLGLGLVWTCSSIFAAADSAVAGATADVDFRPRPSSFASFERCSE